MKQKFKIHSLEYKKANLALKKINDYEEVAKSLSDEELKKQTKRFQEQIANGDSTVDDFIVEAFAIAREATFRVLNKRPYDVQILGGLILHFGSVAEMRTGEGKTIASIAPVYLNALSGKGVIVSTVNEYLTERDAEETGKVHNWLGLSVGINTTNLSPDEKREAYSCDITYSVHSEIGFDYLRDNMVQHINQKVQRGFNFALIDEVDSILIDEARTPLIISGGESSPSSLYLAANQFAKSLKEEHYIIDFESKSIQLSEEGIDKANNFYKTDLFSMENSELVHRIQNALRANYIMELNGDYIVKDEKILLIDAFTGRIMDGRSYADGLQQAIQAKENVEIEDEMKTLATITYQNLFRMFKKLSGMTGTAKTEENEFIEIYNMRVVVIPTNKPIIRKDHRDKVYVTRSSKYKAIAQEVKRLYEKKQPVLIGTSLVEQSERIAKLLKEIKIPYKLLNAKQDGKEADIIAEAGKKGAVTIATNMAGRGTDIKIQKDVIALGGLYVLGTDKSESRRIDNQLRGRSGRQGDIGESRFFLSLDDQLISRFSSQEKLKKTFKIFGEKPISTKAIVKALNRAQKKIEGFNFDSRKNVLQFDDVIRQQRDAIYKQRDMVISQRSISNIIERILSSVVKDIVDFPQFIDKNNDIDIENLSLSLNQVWFANVKFNLEPAILSSLSKYEIIELLDKKMKESYKDISRDAIEKIGEDGFINNEKEILLETLDANWQLHIDQMDKLRMSSSLSSYAQKNPFQVFTEKGLELFQELIKRISHNSVRALMNISY
ncbi:MAG: preprotein translocase subunit SecA [Mycoplasma sp.]|nr:preprotein translocase subunit SecA [Mycoplasma sp.]